MDLAAPLSNVEPCWEMPSVCYSVVCAVWIKMKLHNVEERNNERNTLHALHMFLCTHSGFRVWLSFTSYLWLTYLPFTNICMQDGNRKGEDGTKEQVNSALIRPEDATTRGIAVPSFTHSHACDVELPCGVPCLQHRVQCFAQGRSLYHHSRPLRLQSASTAKKCCNQSQLWPQTRSFSVCLFLKTVSRRSMLSVKSFTK